MIATVPEFTPALEASIMSVSTAKLGRLNGNPLLVRESLKFYIQGLWELQKALWHPRLMYKNETLAACLSLIMYEVVECPGKSIDGWASHMRGCAKMFELKGPTAYDSDFGHQLFLSFRVIEIQQAFAERRRTFLAGQEWISLPFKTCAKSKFQQLLDLVVQVPNIIADGYQMLQAPLEGSTPLDPSVMLAFVLGLVDRCWKVDAQLGDFYACLERESLGPIYWPELSTGIKGLDTETELGQVFPVAFQYLDMRMAHICLLYWATNCILWSGMAYTYQLLFGIAATASLKSGASSVGGKPQFDITDLPPLEHRKDVASQAKNICQSVEYCLLDEHRGLGARAAVFPLKVAIETLHDAHCDRELLWAQAAMSAVNQTGVQLMKHLPVSLTDHAFLPG
ncbi:hypothetical protein D0Z07_4106 [Hyphodiscus hymeniophilus]|uniref:Uncharacterized protein n=1 Tax=Hyphodiscus hymeniophilus TaxID=353542 RepID=A0A9P6VKW6_9HELO|nr:hypothetical protein D0Z07_4106 [Hyphodiscus hymeniophilus]